jgi:aryl-alcohol dehydrogenase-like predicted oxidoreductase
MDYRVFGRTGLQVSTMAMGCNRLGDPGVDAAAWPPLVERALALGVTFFDTAMAYNDGRSERVLGQVSARHAGRGAGGRPVVVSTKVGMRSDAGGGAKDFSATAILGAVDAQLERLRRDAIDVYLLHSPTVAQMNEGDWPAAFERLKADGRVTWAGISTSDHASGIAAVERGADVLQIQYDLLFPTAEDALLPVARAHDVGVMVRTPLARGLLTGKFAPGQPLPPDQQWRRPRGDQLQRRLARVEQLRFLERPGQTLGQAALRFVVAHPGVHCAAPGARTVDQLEANCAAAGGALTADELARIKDLQAQWRREGQW